MADAEDKLQRTLELTIEANRKTHETVAEAKMVRKELREAMDDARELLTRVRLLANALGNVLE